MSDTQTPRTWDEAPANSGELQTNSGHRIVASLKLPVEIQELVEFTDEVTRKHGHDVRMIEEPQGTLVFFDPNQPDPRPSERCDMFPCAKCDVKSERPTPRTDQKQGLYECSACGNHVVSADFARQLERNEAYTLGKKVIKKMEEIQ